MMRLAVQQLLGLHEEGLAAGVEFLKQTLPVGNPVCQLGRWGLGLGRQEAFGEDLAEQIPQLLAVAVVLALRFAAAVHGRRAGRTGRVGSDRDSVPWGLLF